MLTFLKLIPLLIASSDGIPVVALPAPTRLAPSPASIFMGRARILPLSTEISNKSQPGLSISGRGTESRQAEQSENQQQQTADPTPCGMFTGILRPTEDVNGVLYATKSTIASSQMNATVTMDATTSAETITIGAPPSPFIVAGTRESSSQNGNWPSSSKFAAEPTSTAMIASSRIKAAVTSDATTSAGSIGLGSSSSAVTAASTNTVRLTTMNSSTVGANVATKTLSVSLFSKDTSCTTPPTPSSPIATTMAMAMTTESAEAECLDETVATPNSRGGGTRGHKSYRRCQIEISSPGTSGLGWWKMISILIALPLWILVILVGVVCAFIMVLGCRKCHPQPGHPADPACEAIRHERGLYSAFDMMGHGEDSGHGTSTFSLESRFKGKEWVTC